MPHRVAVHRPEHEGQLAPDCLHAGGVQHHQGEEADTVAVQTQVLNRVKGWRLWLLIISRLLTFPKDWDTSISIPWV